MISASDLELVKADAFVRAVEFHRELPSTNDLALQHATHEELDTPFLVLTEYQTAGRGRGGNKWWSAPGALTFSLVLDTSISTDAPTGACDPRLSVTTALSLHDALSQYVPPGDVRLKWPNDVYLGSRKVAGILLEQSSACPGRLVVGVGINVNNSLSAAPDEIRQRATSLYDRNGAQYPLHDVLRTVLKQMARRYEMLAANTLRLSIQWQELCLLRTHFVSVTSGERIVTGLCSGIDDQGALLIHNDSGVHQLMSGVACVTHRCTGHYFI